MGGRGSSSKMSNSGGFIARLQDSTDFGTFVRSNLSDEDFMALGREAGMDAIKQLWYEKRALEELKNVHEISLEDAVSQVRDAISASTLDGWFRDANSDYKPRLIDSIMSNSGTLNAGMNIAYNNYLDSNPSNPMPFETWLRTPQTMYRGDRGQRATASDIFTSFTLDRKVAESFGSHVTTAHIRPIDTWGSYQTTGEQEFLVPVIDRSNR